MRYKICKPLILNNVKLLGPKGFVKVDMILDTKAVVSSISWTDLKLIGYDPAVVPDLQKIITANGIVEIPKLRVECIAVGDIKAKSVEVVWQDIPDLVRVRGLLGLNFLKNFTTVINYRQDYLEIS